MTTPTPSVTEWLDLLPQELIWQALSWGFLFGLAGLLTAVAVIIYLARKSLLRREHRVWNALAKLSYVVTLIVFVGGGFALGAVYGANRLVTDALREIVHPALEAQMPAFRRYLSGSLGQYLPDQPVTPRMLIEPYVKQFYYVPKSDGIVESTKAKVINELILKYAADKVTERFDAMISQQLETLGAGLDGAVSAAGPGARSSLTAKELETFVASMAKNVDFKDLDSTLPAIVVNAIGEKISGYFSSLYKTIGLLASLMLGLVILEIVIYRTYFLPGRSRLAEAAAVSG